MESILNTGSSALGNGLRYGKYLAEDHLVGGLKRHSVKKAALKGVKVVDEIHGEITAAKTALLAKTDPVKLGFTGKLGQSIGYVYGVTATLAKMSISLPLIFTPNMRYKPGSMGVKPDSQPQPAEAAQPTNATAAGDVANQVDPAMTSVAAHSDTTDSQPSDSQPTLAVSGGTGSMTDIAPQVELQVTTSQGSMDTSYSAYEESDGKTSTQEESATPETDPLNASIVHDTSPVSGGERMSLTLSVIEENDQVDPVITAEELLTELEKLPSKLKDKVSDRFEQALRGDRAIWRYLDLSGLELTDAQLAQLILLISRCGITWLDLNGNGLTTVPESIKLLGKLIWLELGGNRLTAVPEPIELLKNLICLGLSDNQLKELPKFMEKLGKLIYLDLSDNPSLMMKDIPQSLIDRANKDKLTIVGLEEINGRS